MSILDADPDVDARNAIPPEGFLRRYAEYQWHTCDAPLVFAIPSGLSALAAAVDPQLDVEYGAPCPGTFWGLLVGGSGTRKTTAARKAFKIADKAVPDRIGAEHESAASLVESLSTAPQQLVFHGEFGDWLKATSSGGYRSDLRPKYTALWDGDRQTKTGLKRGAVTVDRPRVSVLACVAPALLEEFTDDNDWAGGFFTRFCVVYGERLPGGRLLSPPPRWPEAEAWLVSYLREFSARPVGPVTGFTPGAHQLLAQWEQAKTQVLQSRNNRLTAGVFERLDSVVLKTAMLHGADWGRGMRAGGAPWMLSEDELIWGIRVAQIHFKSVLKVIESLARTTYGRDRRTVLTACSAAPQTLGDILRAATPKLPKKRVVEVLETLEAEGLVGKTAVGGGFMWSIVPDRAVAGE